MERDRNGLEVLGRDECLRLLATATLGRVGITADALPAVLPVNFCMAGERILIRTGQGTKLDAAVRNAVVAFEADHFEPIGHTGWSVMVTGVAKELTDEETETMVTPPLVRWAPWGDGHTMAISTDLVSGRRITTGLGGDRPG